MNNKLMKIVKEHHKGGVTSSDCIACSSPCCGSGGFAILENVLAIYEVYTRGELIREDYEFPKNLSLIEFVENYFDVIARDVNDTGNEDDYLVFFHMRSLDENKRPISVPPDDFWETRADLFNQNPWLSKGCVFLSHSVDNYNEDDANTNRHCILHGKKSSDGFPVKPIDCSHFTCTKKGYYKPRYKVEQDVWYNKINTSYPGSVKRFKQIIGEST